jgi:hypothetical protein
MQVSVTDNLNVRTERPSVNAPNATYLQPGDPLVIDGIMYKGDAINGNDVWVKDLAGSFYWSGGLTVPSPLTGVDYRAFLSNMDAEVLNTQGEAVTVVIIDEGINFNGAYFDLTKVSSADVNNDPVDSNHAVFIAGIIAGIKSVLGIAVKAEIVSIKYKSDNLDLTGFLIHMAAALTEVTQMSGPLVLNLSQSFARNTLSQNANEVGAITSLIQQISAQPNKLIVCAAGDNGTLAGTLPFPANLPECLSVGTLDAKSIGMALPAELNMISAMSAYSSFALDYSITTDSGSSFFCALMSALISCLLSKNPGAVFKNTDVLAWLAPYVTDKARFEFGALQSLQFQIN